MSQGEGRAVFIRHGHTEWNLTNRFTGWTDVDLSALGIAEAEQAAKRLANAGFHFDEAHLSRLRRTQQTWSAMADVGKWQKLPVFSSWRLNERHYGALQGLNKQEIFTLWGEERSRRWWRGYHEPPPPLPLDDPRHPRYDPLYADLDPQSLPASESLFACQQRLLPYWYDVLRPRLAAGATLLIVSHGNSIRSLVMELERITPEAMMHLEIPSGVPLLYRFAADGTLVERQWLD